MQQYIIKKVEVQHSISSESINHSIFLFQFAKHYKLLTNLMLLTKLTNFKGCELVESLVFRDIDNNFLLACQLSRAMFWFGAMDKHRGFHM